MTKKKTDKAGKKKISDRRETVQHSIHRDKDVSRRTKKQSRKPDFEKALEEIKKQDQPVESLDQEVGTRPGPSQLASGAEEGPAPPDNLAKIDRQQSKAPQALAPVLKIPFSIWANVSQIEEMKLTDAEAEEWAEPIVALLDYYFPGRIPEIIWIWLMFLSATEKVIDSRVKIRYEKRQERKRLQPSTSTPGYREPAAQTAQSAPRHNGAEPTDQYPKE